LENGRFILLSFFGNLSRFNLVRTQFSKDDVDASDSLLVGLFDDDFNGDGRVRVD
jgi:hypothetical protein